MNTGRRAAPIPDWREASEQERLRAIVDRIADGIVIVSEEGIIRFANPAAEQLFGRSATELAGRDLGFPVVDGDTTEVEVVQPQQHTVTAELRAVEIEWEGKRGHLISLRDVTDRKQAAERALQLERERLARTEAEAASHAKSEFLALMSHELRTPLNAVIGYADLLQLGLVGELSPEQRAQISRIAASGRHLLGLVNEVLDLARVEAGRLLLHRGTGRCDLAVKYAKMLVMPIADAAQVKVTLLDAGDAGVSYGGDEDRVRQILVNLLNNAVKFSPAGGQVTVTWGAASKPEEHARLFGSGPWCFFRVEDTGMGIPAEKLGAIFEPFVQVEKGHTRSKEGSGLGLTISRRLARLMNGDLTVRSELGKGSTFTLWLRDATAAVKQAERWRARSPEMAERLQGLEEVGKVLLRELEPLLDAFVARLREQPMVESAKKLRDCQLSNHLGEYLVGLAGTLAAMEQGQDRASAVVAERAAIQLILTESHGTQRAELGWTPELLQREWTILREETERIIRLHSRGLREQAVAEALQLIGKEIERAIAVSSNALHCASTPADSADLLRGQSSAAAEGSAGSSP